MLSQLSASSPGGSSGSAEPSWSAELRMGSSYRLVLRSRSSPPFCHFWHPVSLEIGANETEDWKKYSKNEGEVSTQNVGHHPFQNALNLLEETQVHKVSGVFVTQQKGTTTHQNSYQISKGEKSNCLGEVTFSGMEIKCSLGPYREPCIRQRTVSSKTSSKSVSLITFCNASRWYKHEIQFSENSSVRGTRQWHPDQGSTNLTKQIDVSINTKPKKPKTQAPQNQKTQFIDL